MVKFDRNSSAIVFSTVFCQSLYPTQSVNKLSARAQHKTLFTRDFFEHKEPVKLNAMKDFGKKDKACQMKHMPPSSESSLR